MFRFLLLFFVLVPLIEIYFLIQIGGVVGAGWTIFLILMTAVIGTALLRMQGIVALKQAQVALIHGQLPALAMMKGVILLISGTLLLTPGFFTDTIGFMLLIPVCQQILIKCFARRGHFSFYCYTKSRSEDSYNHADSNVIEGKYSRDDDHRLN